MAAVFQELVIKWRGDEVMVKPTMELINRIENRVSLSRVAFRLAEGDPPLSHLATIVAHFLRAGGVKVDDDEVYVEIMQGTQKQISDLAALVMTATFPQSGKVAARSTKPGSRRKRTGKNISRSG